MVTYMTENFVSRLANGVNPYFVAKLNISGKNKSHKIKVIENLSNFVNLQYLNLSNNNISRLSGLDKLVRLKQLNVSWNAITCLSGLEALENLLILDLTGNGISIIPSWLCKKLNRLKTLHVGRNKICTLDQLLRLRGLQNLTTLSFLGNPAVDQLVLGSVGSDSDSTVATTKDQRESTYRSYALFHLRTILILDGKPVRPEEFDDADKRFGQAELSTLTGKLRGQEERLLTLEQINATLERGLQCYEKKTLEEQAKRNEQSMQLSRLECELQAKDELLKSRSEELARACLKYYELEQELAFHKIDSKLAHFLLGPPPPISAEQLSNIDTGNFPYLGRCRSRRLPVALPKSTQPIPCEHVEPLLFEANSNTSDHQSSQTAEWSMTMVPTSTPRSQYEPAAEIHWTLHKVVRHRSEQSEDTALGLSNRSSTATYKDVSEHKNVSSGDDLPQNNLRYGSGSKNKSMHSPNQPAEVDQAREEIPNAVSGTVERTLVVTDANRRSDQLETERELARSLRRLHEVSTGQQIPTDPPRPCSADQLKRKSPLDQDNSGTGSAGSANGSARPPPSPRARSANRNSRNKRERSASLPVQGIIDPAQHRRCSVHPDSTRISALGQVALGQTPVPFQSPPDMDYDSPNAHPTQYSGTSSTPSSRTTGTGRSVIPSNAIFEIRAPNNKSEQHTSSPNSPADCMIPDDPAWGSGSVQSPPTSYDSHQSEQLHASSSGRKPGVGLSQTQLIPNSIGPSESSQVTKRNGAKVNPSQSAQSIPAPTVLSFTEPGKFRKSVRCDSSEQHQTNNQPNMYTPSTHHGSCRSTMLDRFDELCSSSNQSGNGDTWEPCVTCHAPVAPDSIHLRTSASGASTSGLVSRRRKRRVIRSLSHMMNGSGTGCRGGLVGGCSARILRTRGDVHTHRSRRGSTDTLDDQASELLHMLAMSRRACASEVDKIRADLAWIQQTMPRLYTNCGQTDYTNHDLGGSTLYDRTNNATHNPVYDVLRTMDSTEGRLDTRNNHLVARSYMDSMTNVTRPSPNAPNEVSSFGEEDDAMDGDVLGTTIAEHGANHSSPTRVRPSGEFTRRTTRGRRMLPAATLLVEDEGTVPVQALHGCRLRQNPVSCTGQWTPEYQDLNRAQGYGSPTRTVHGRQSSSIPRDFYRTASYPARSNAYCSTYHGDHRAPMTRTSAPGLLASPRLGSRPPRGRSLDLSHASRDPHRPHETTQPRSTVLATNHTAWAPGTDQVDEEDPSTETAALLNLTEELLGLRQGLKQTKRANASRLEVALRQISMLELELQRQRCLTHDAQLARDRQTERARWERRLAATLSELKQCQVHIGQLRAQMDQLATTADHNSASQAQFDRQKVELEETKSALDAQKEEISRLNRLLHQLLGVDPADASPGDLAQLQAGLVELNRKMQTDSVRPMNFSDPVRRCQSMHTGLAPGTADQPRAFGFLTPGGSRTTAGNLYCNVPEHHYLEDCMDQLQTKLHEAQLLETEQQKKLRQTTKAKRKLEKQIEEQNESIEKLTGELNARQEELNQVQEKFKHLSEEKDSAQKSDQVHLSFLANDMLSIENVIRERRAELTNLEAQLHETSTALTSVQTQVHDASAKLHETHAQQAELESELSTVRAQLKSSKNELVELQGDVDLARIQAQKFESSRSELETSVKQLESTIHAKQDEFKRVSTSVNEVDTKLSQLRAELSAGEARLQTQQKLMADDETALNERRAELRRLSSKIMEDEARLESLAREIGEQRTELELIHAKQQRDLNAVTQDARELSTKTAVKQRELAETQTSLNALLDERAQLTAFVESLRAEQNTLQLDLQEKQKTLTDLSATLLRQRRELEHTTDMARLEETRVNELTSQQRELLDQLHKLQAEVRAESNELRGRDVAKMKKTSELQVTRTEAERESSELQRLIAERRAAESDLAQVQQQTDLTRTQLNNMRRKVKELEKQESELLQSISTSKRQLTKIAAEREAESLNLRGLRSERASCQSEFDHLSECLEASRVELERAQQRLSSAQSAADSQDSELAEQQRQRIQMNDELSKLGEAVHLGRLAKQNTDEERESSESALQATRTKLEKSKSEKRQIDESALKRRDKKLASGYRELESVNAELMKKTAALKSIKEKMKDAESRLAEMGATEARCLELERLLQEKDRELKQLQQMEHHMRHKLSDNLHGTSNSDSDLARVLEETKAALAASRRDSKRLKRRTTRELSELERIAEEQCQRAGELTEQLTLVKRQYAQLKGQISTYGILMDEVITVASQTELSEHGRRLEAALAAVRAELAQNLRDEEEALFPTDPATTQPLYGSHTRHATEQETQFPHSEQATSDLHRSLLVLTNSFHDLCHPSTQQQSKSMLTLNDFTRSTPGLYRSGVIAPAPETPPAAPGPIGTTIVEVGESTAGTYRTGTTTATSGLGSSLNPTNTADQEPSGDSLAQHDQHELLVRKNGLKDKMIDRVSKQRIKNATEWEQSHSQFRAIREQVDRVKGQLDGANGSSRTTSNSRGSRLR